MDTVHAANFLSSPMVPWIVVLAATFIAALTDLFARRIPNSLSACLFASGLVYSLWTQGATGLGSALAGCVLLALPFIVLFILADGGAGDAKLMGAVGAWLGTEHTVAVILAVVISGAVMAILVALTKRRILTAAENLVDMVRLLAIYVVSRGRLMTAHGLLPRTESTTTIPYAVAIFAGVGFAAGVIVL